MGKKRKPITTPKFYVFTCYSVASGEQAGFSCFAKNEERAEKKFYRNYNKNVGEINEIIEL